jgi:DNA-binding FrmR family transcriptional regulator
MPDEKTHGCKHCAAGDDVQPEPHPSHRTQLNALARIEGQVRGIRRMIEDGRYCVDILIQTRAVHAALQSVERRVLQRHLETCVRDAFQQDDDGERERKISEILALFGRDTDTLP